MAKNFDVVIIGGGILGTSISYFLSHLNKSKKIAVIEQARNVAFHTSGRNTGKIHAPYLYNPEKKKLFANAAFHGFDMWQEYSKLHDLPFKKDGVIEVALDKKGIKVLEKYLKWAKQNGLEEKDIELMDKSEIKKIEPEIRCESALCVYRDGSTDYSTYTESLMKDSKQNGTTFLLDTKVTEAKKENGKWKVTLNQEDEIFTEFLINAAGGEAVDIAHNVGIATELTDVHFRGEYWKAPKQYNNLTKTSIYSVPEFPDYPFLDPHWIIRVDGSCEIGPNAVPVFSPYGYNKAENIKEFVPKMLEMLGSGARKAIFDKQFQELAMNEIQSSMSKSAMVERVKRFLPKIDAEKITEKGTAGIRSSIINEKGKFEPDVILLDDESSFHILNYNSPGATGALPFAAHIVNHLHKSGLFSSETTDAQCGPWKFSEIIEKIEKK
ncbi:putative malatequinone oxidoreductase protein [Marine Group I thaumarchaeote SCGC AAA799-E16]|uniref:Putative malatequinone oxidoreductase protein n=5 Tax=Marine Group I TaxID=905826 RepID=A0A087S7Z8_9ARCH|nr:putative malatequinone oxidoreductase protein [Marine Group I thaumarchaeote SCGC AAA799-N04]KER05508.1 putative malatequinone oxidoreductase protein [Marine Group I thaumarchaeote SCGC AAA799-E16]KFM17036.1 putative malatequinone oxidoreductase protein [Marine Group I thaumarchaeote SCGC AAA799-D11]KFM19138.1 putative malatequinone oxidoreductase protein [Marine Group I thaumarchaeote SCGC RSA3]KFM21852.1 putative malatequinone oxidoreductase protein [Marine Group I thaumarchaeote SCGC AAA7